MDLNLSPIDYSDRLRLCDMRGQFITILCIFSVATTFISCDSDRSFADKIYKMPMRHLENYDFNSESSFSQRLNLSGDMVLRYLQDMDADPTYTLYNPTKSEKTMLEEYFNLLAAPVYNLCKERLVGIYFIDGFYGSGLTDFIYGEEGEIYTILALNPSVLHKSISELFTFKDSSCFKNDNKEIRLEIEISDVYSGLLYILFHEAAHIVDYVAGDTPYVHRTMKRLGIVNKGEAPFTEQYWSDYNIPDDSVNLRYRESLKFYSEKDKKLISDDDMIQVYGELENSPFCSLYSTVNWAEDYAEYVSLYHMTQILDLNYTIRIYQKKSLVYEYSPFENELILQRAKHLYLLRHL